MAKQKTKFGWFTIPEWEKEEKWLREQHKNGWKLIKAIPPGFYKFEQCEPEDVIYQLDYNQEGMNHMGEYIQMFRDCGWEYVTDMMGYAYFRKPAKEMVEDEGIFCDDESKIEMIERVYNGKMLPLIVIFCCCIMPQLFMQSHNTSEAGRVLFIGFVALFILYLSLFVKFAYQYWKVKNRREK